jgi:hypothetical protein
MRYVYLGGDHAHSHLDVVALLILENAGTNQARFLHY